MEVGAVSGILDTTLALVFTWVGYKTSLIIYKYTPYSYPNARIKAMEARLLTEQRFNELAESGTLQDFAVSLEDTDYRNYFVEIQSYNVESIERAFEEALAGTYEMMAKILPKRVNPFFKLLLEEWDVRNITSVIKAKFAGEPAEDYVMEIGFMFPRANAIAEAKSIEEILVILEGTPYEEPYQKLLLDEIDVRTFETELYRMHYRKLLNYALSKKDEERTILEEFVRLKIDKMNILTVLRAKAAKLPAEEIRPMLIPGGSIKLESLLHVEDLGMALAELDSTKYGPVIRDVREEVERDLGVLEKVLNGYMLKRMNELNRFYPLSVAAPLVYILQKEREVKKLRAIAKLISDGLQPERIKELVGDVA
ncbi:V-type ATP synthase subunit C [Thermococcus sp.]|uniref:V-type ATP synthase subunit C n=1 Tax=Thermococcus sp. TaxID=35749 RepID=UPI002604971A|nr:V-type ATP synthase subunit C [Thermococcus sp.]